MEQLGGYLDDDLRECGSGDIQRRCDAREGYDRSNSTQRGISSDELENRDSDPLWCLRSLDKSHRDPSFTIRGGY